MSEQDKTLDSAIALHRAGKLQEAQIAYADILAKDSRNANALHLLGLVAYQLGNFQEAAMSIDTAISVDPKQPKFLSNRGNVAKAMGENHQALRFYQRALEADADFVDARFNLGVLLQEMGELEGAAEAYSAILLNDPDNPDVRNNLGLVKLLQGKLDEAERLFDMPEKNQDVLLNQAFLFERRGRLHKAETSYRKAIELNPEKAEAYFNLGCLLDRRGKVAQAIESLERAVNLNPAYEEAKTALRHQYMHACMWPEIEALNKNIKDGAKRSADDGRTAETPFFSVVRSADATLNLAVARSWASHIEDRFKPLFDHSSRQTSSDSEQITIGYLSNDIQDHATAHLLGGLFGAHNRDRFRICVYSYGSDDGSPYRSRISETCDSFIDVREYDHESAARRIHADGVDILVDLKGWTRGNRLQICAHRPAPVQVTYLGFPGSTGASFFDYAIVDWTVAPPEEAAQFSETLAYLPHCYQANDGAQNISDMPINRLDHELPGEGIVFCCFNSPYKIEADLFEIWMRILSSVPDSVLWLYDGNDVARSNMEKAAANFGIDADRLVFARHVQKNVHLRRIQLADLALDTQTCNGHTTTSDALWAGVPVIALEGSHFASRVSSSCLKSIGMHDLIAGSLEEYRDLAVGIACDETIRTALKSRLWTNRLREPLFDTVGFTRGLENLYTSMWDRFTSDLPPVELWPQAK